MCFVEMQFMKVLTTVIFSMVIFSADACKYAIRSEAKDSFGVGVFISDPRVVVEQFIDPFWARKLIPYDPYIIEGRTPEMCGKSAGRCSKEYTVEFKEMYTPPRGGEPYILFKNDRAEFKLVFLEENYAELRSDQASEFHDDPGRREYDRNHPYNKDRSYRPEDEYAGTVRHWMVVGPYIVVYCYERYTSFRRCVAICNASDDNSWVSTIKEVDFDKHLGIDLPPWPPQPPKRSCQSWLCDCCCCCDD
jgi:hypothetical protein